ncbi:nicotinate-nucleotide--dimethylbenzimidazole phosphoribosyltransferase [Dissulfurirhabdus thermomarina]|uniref:Nicotinate-nucleotide--dimethylbenzimidazole phosphoribosyltransferase n=1 Tax=Dissulfurirhabdus thermomarina TaxID=1765737 RepID=A0A6N9TRH1_DISTH|nr:nicotinate-nucleotide--dimethylbenzimidazole phosphoribosyltransferase [Dissulfurirhabdus thermomarina]NDY42354.1 nicotinate-nucleotide--dimethylbenzimidazole phosphoribosyltransferase [Dissulfurirhabdus thermomarina]
MQLDSLLQAVRPVDESPAPEIQAHLDNLTKPRGSLGRLEELALRYCLIRGERRPALPAKAVFVFAADHGVTEEGVSAFPREVTYQMVRNFLAGGAGINVLARHVGAEVHVVDIGVDHDFPELPGLIRRKVRPGTRNMARGPALTREEAEAAVLAGAELASGAADRGIGLLATGEMGIGNTTPSSALTAVFCGAAPAEVTGRGTGIDDEAHRRKVRVIERALEVNRPDPADPLGVLAAVGGLEIAGICGLVLGAAARGVPVVIDGFISTAGALVAAAMAPAAAGYMFAAHQSVEVGHRKQLERLGLRPVLDLDLRLGEGTGAALAMGLIEAGLKIYLEMATFDGAQVSPGNEA